jgi:single-stranded DNA-binding protein
MSITALVAGKLIADPERRTGQSGKAYVLAKVAAHDGEADSLVSVMAFGSAADQLAALGKGDAVAINGRAKVNTWSGRDGTTKAGLSVTADAVLSAYSLKRKRQAVADASAPKPQAAHATQAAERADEFGDAGDDWLRGGEPSAVGR